MVSQTKKIIHADIVKLCQGNQDLRRDHPFSAFVISISSLGNIDLFAKLCLRQVSIFS